jgi:hypothetical protein
MTLIGAFDSTDVVMFADRQETLSDWAKWDANKIFYYEFFAHFRIIMSGAGDSNFIDMIWEEVSSKAKEMGFGFAKTPPTDVSKIRELVIGTVSRITRKCILPYPRNDRPMVDLIWAIQQRTPIPDPGPTWPIDLFHTYGLSVNRVNGHYFSGSPMLLMKYISNLYLDGLFLRTEEAEALAVYLLWEAKEYDPSCGKYGDIITLKRSGEVRGMSLSEIKYWEDHFKHLKKSMRILPLLSCASPFTEQMYKPQDHLQKFLTIMKTLTRESKSMRAKTKDLRTQLEKTLTANLARKAKKASRQPKPEGKNDTKTI